MSAYEAGDRVLLRGEVLRHEEGVGVLVELFSKTDQYNAWVREDLLVSGVVLDLPDTVIPERMAAALRDSSFAWLADQIEAQTTPPRIPEPGLWGVVEARYGATPPRTFIRHPEGWASVTEPGRAGIQCDWGSLVDPVLIREGVES